LQEPLRKLFASPSIAAAFLIVNGIALLLLATPVILAAAVLKVPELLGAQGNGVPPADSTSHPRSGADRVA
jgi:hypothetical protein